MELFVNKFQIFTLLLARMLAMLSVAPMYSAGALSYFAKIGIAFLVSLIVTPVLPVSKELEALVANKYFILIAEQIFVGLLIGIAMQFLFAAFQMAGEFFSVQMGFGISEVFDPVSQTSLPLLGIVKNLIATYVFFISNAHLYLIKALVYSYEKFPFLAEGFLINDKVQNGILAFIVKMSASMFSVAFKIALPIIGVLMMVSLTLGLLYKAAPQMNILMLGFPIKILVAFIFLAIVSPLVVGLMFAQFDRFFAHMDRLIVFWFLN